MRKRACIFSLLVLFFSTDVYSQTIEEIGLLNKIEATYDISERENLYVELINEVRSHSFDSAQLYIDELKSLNSENKCSSCYVQAIFMEGHLLFSQDSLEKALDAYENTKIEANKINDVSLFLLANLRASAVLKRMGRYKEAQSSLLQSLSGVRDSIKSSGLKVFVDHITKDLDEARIKEELREERSINRQKEFELLNERRIWIVSIVALILLLGGLTIMLYFKKKRQKMKLELLSSKLNTLKLQMNPHFIFNCLNSIKGLVVSNQNEKAADYLTIFSKLTRMILEKSSYDEISLREELQFIEIYVDTEKHRGIIDFNFELVLDVKTGIDELKVFPFLLQPFVENAIKHAFNDLNKGDNLLRLTITDYKEGWILFEIEDNGCGVFKNSDHQSKGVELIKDRLALINKTQDNVVTEFRGKNKGTLVKLKLRI